MTAKVRCCVAVEKFRNKGVGLGIWKKNNQFFTYYCSAKLKEKKKKQEKKETWASQAQSYTQISIKKGRKSSEKSSLPNTSYTAVS